MDRDGRFSRFIAVGLLNTVVGYSLFGLLHYATGDHNLSVVVSSVLGIFFNFLTTGQLVFANRSWRKLLPFVLAYGVALSVNLLLLNVLLALGVPALLGQALCLPVVVIVAFGLNARYVFPRSAEPARPPHDVV